jgi:hypothetical protein
MTTTTFDASIFTPQMARIIRLAIIEQERDSAGLNNLVGVEHICAGALQDDCNYLSALIRATGMTLSDVRNGHYSKPGPGTP